jgi:hypothetical protein
LRHEQNVSRSDLAIVVALASHDLRLHVLELHTRHITRIGKRSSNQVGKAAQTCISAASCVDCS